MWLRISFKVLLLCVVLWGIGGGPAGALMIDNFDDPPSGQSVTILNGIAGSAATSTALGLSTLGGSRKISVTVEFFDIPGGNETSLQVNTFTSPGNCQLTQTILVNSYGLITYNADNAGLNVDLSGFGGIELVGLVSDLTDAFTLTLETFGGGSSSITKNVAGGNIPFLFSSLVGTANLNDIDSITIKIDPPRGGDVKIDAIVTLEPVVPAPATLLLFGSGLIGLAGYGRRRFRK